RAVYEKARSALVGQLRAIQPPLPAREITQHRLQLEDCIRQVEQEASEAVIQLGRDAAFGARAHDDPAPRSSWSAPAAEATRPEPAPSAPAQPPVTASTVPASAPEPVAAMEPSEPPPPEPEAEPDQPEQAARPEPEQPLAPP